MLDLSEQKRIGWRNDIRSIRGRQKLILRTLYFHVGKSYDDLTTSALANWSANLVSAPPFFKVSKH